MKASINLQQTYTDSFLQLNPHIVIDDLVDYLEPESFNPETQKMGGIILVNGLATHEIINKSPEEIAEANRAKVPESISQMKLRKQLILSGISIASIDALIQTLPQPNRDLIYTMWEYAVVFDRSNSELNAMAEMLGITQEQLDEIFINGNLL